MNKYKDDTAKLEERMKIIKKDIISLLVLVTLIPSCAILLGALEQRFMILPYLFIYYWITHFNYKKIDKRKTLVLIMFYILFMICTLAIDSEIIGSLKNHPMIFKG